MQKLPNKILKVPKNLPGIIPTLHNKLNYILWKTIVSLFVGISLIAYWKFINDLITFPVDTFVEQ